MEVFGSSNSKSCILLLVSVACLLLATYAQRCPRNRLSSYARKRLGRQTINRLCSRTKEWNSGAKKRSRTQFNEALSSKQRKWFNRVCRKANGCNRRRKRQSGFGRYPPVTRKEYRMMSDDERNRFHRAVNALKNSRIDNLSKYEILVVYHTPENAPGAHFGAAFLPFHREMLKYLEVALRIEDPQVSIPYWDSTLDQALPNPVDSVMWSDQFLGNPRGPVTSGPFSGWRVYDNPRAREMSPTLELVRNAGGGQFGSLYRPADIQQIQNSVQSFSGFSFCINPFFEMVHGAVHIWVGGTMDPLEASPNDPVFYMLHAFVDALWEEFRQSRQTPFQRQNSYATTQQACNSFHYRNSAMRPFNKRNIDGLSDEYTTSFYNYQERPSCGAGFDRCSNAYLFCHRGLGRCVSKVRTGGNCRGLEQYDSCAYGRCTNGRCVFFAVPTQPPTVATTIPRRTVAPTTDRETVWFPVTIQQYSDRRVRRVDNAFIRTTVLGTGDVYFGELSQEDDYPYYVGAAFVQIPNPTLQRDPITVRVTADGHGKDCQTLCYEGFDTGYAECDITMRLSRSSQSVPVAYTPFKEQAPYLSWNGPERKPARYYLLCPFEDEPLPALEQLGRANVLGFAKPTGNRETFEITDCVNKHRCCKLWQSVGECERNPDYLSTACPAACGVCRSKGGSGCTDRSNRCEVWQDRGECDRNPSWMDENCARSCGVCRRPLSELTLLCGAKEEGTGCTDYDTRCERWSRNGECEKNTWWMGQNCPRACDVCSSK